MRFNRRCLFAALAAVAAGASLATEAEAQTTGQTQPARRPSGSRSQRQQGSSGARNRSRQGNSQRTSRRRPTTPPQQG